MANVSNDLRQVDELLASARIAWLLGAGSSVDAGVPLMNALTERVFSMVGKKGSGILDAIREELPANAHIEHCLNHMNDYIVMAQRREDHMVKIGGVRHKRTLQELQGLHDTIQRDIAETIRWGYRPKCEISAREEQIGNSSCPVVGIDHHMAFIEALFNRRQAGLENRRDPICLFTTNYDTLVEDALALSRIPYWDGFSGGAIAYRSHYYGNTSIPKECRAQVIKLHGSIDWYWGPDERIYRVRYGDLYPESSRRVIIYPQATKYVATQRDPFSAQFDILRRKLNSSNENVLAVCGYSFGDDHINDEIELALTQEDNKTTLMVFSKGLNPVLSRWQEKAWAERLYVLTAQGLYVGKNHVYESGAGTLLDWWQFSEVTKILVDGIETATKKEELPDEDLLTCR